MQNIIAVTIAFNDPDNIAKLIQALMNQTYPISEIIIVDNSNKNMKEVNRKLAESVQIIPVRYIAMKENIGASGGFALGMTRALRDDAPWIWLNDSDGVPATDCLEKLIDFSRKNPTSKIVAPIVVLPSGKILSRFRVSLNVFGNLTIPVTKGGEAFDVGGTSGILINHEVIKSVGTYDPVRFFVGLGDCDYCLRAVEYGYTPFLVRDALYFHPDIGKKRENYHIGRFLPPFLFRFFPMSIGGISKNNSSKRHTMEIYSRAYIVGKHLDSIRVKLTFYHSLLRAIISKILNGDVDLKATVETYKKGITDGIAMKSTNYPIEKDIDEIMKERILEEVFFDSR